MDKEQKRKIRKRLQILSYVVIGIALVYIFYVGLVKRSLGVDYYVVLIGCLAVFWLLNDVLIIVMTKDFEGKTPEQIKAYKTYALLNLLGLAGLGFFALSLNSSNGMLGVLVYVMTMMTKRKYLDMYRKAPEQAEPTPIPQGGAQKAGLEEDAGEEEAEEDEADKEVYLESENESNKSRESEEFEEIDFEEDPEAEWGIASGEKRKEEPGKESEEG